MKYSENYMDQVKELFNNEAAAKRLAQAASAEELQAIFTENGLELDLEIAQQMLDKMAAPEGELTMDELDEVAGGFGISATVAAAALFTGLVIGVINRQNEDEKKYGNRYKTYDFRLFK